MADTANRIGGYEGGDRVAREMFTWNPPPHSGDSALLPQLPTLIGRAQDLTNNSGLIAGAVQLVRDLVIGPGLRLNAKPDWRTLGLSAEWAREWSREVETKFRGWALDVDCRSDVSRRLNLNQRLRQVIYTLLVKGSALAIAEWRPDRDPFYSTCIRMVDPDRLGTPPNKMRDPQFRNGIQYSRDGIPVAYYIRNKHPAEHIHGTRTVYDYRRVPAFTPWGRRRVLHVYDSELPDQSFGKTILATIIKRAKMLDTWDNVTLESAAIHAMYSVSVESELDSAIEAIGGIDELNNYAEQLVSWYKSNAVRFDGVKIPRLFPGEKVNLNRSEQPTTAFPVVEAAFLRHFASALGLSNEQFTRDYSKTTYSGAVAGQQDAWRTLLSRRGLIQESYATQEYALWLEEAFNRGDIPQPDGSPAFYDAKTAWTNCTWIGRGRSQLDNSREISGRAQALDNNADTLENWCAEQGRDWEEVIEQRAREQSLIAEIDASLAEE